MTAIAAYHARLPTPTPESVKVAQALGRRLRARIALLARLDPRTATGFALALGWVTVIAGGLLVATLVVLLRHSAGLVELDRSVSQWGFDHATPSSTDVLTAITDAGAPSTVFVLAVILALGETLRTRSRWVLPFVCVVVAGNGLLTTTIKHLADRVRPELNPIAATFGPSFPSGHSSWSAAFCATAVLLLGRGRSTRTRALLTGVGAALAVAVASSRVLLNAHWLTDVIGGLALGLAWFSLCALAFGGRVLRFGTTAKVAGEVARTERAAEHRHGAT